MREYIVCICFSILFCVGISLLVPARKYEGTIKIVCGIFVISTIVGPVKNIISYDGASFGFEGYFDITDLDRRVSQSEEKFAKALRESGTQSAQAAIEKEIEILTGCDAEVSLSEKCVVISSADTVTQDMVSYIKDSYSLDVIFTD